MGNKRRNNNKRPEKGSSSSTSTRLAGNDSVEEELEEQAEAVLRSRELASASSRSQEPDVDMDYNSEDAEDDADQEGDEERDDDSNGEYGLDDDEGDVEASQEEADSSNHDGDEDNQSESESESAIEVEEVDEDQVEERRKQKLASLEIGFRSDLGHMAAFNDAPLDAEKVKDASTRNAYLRERAQANVELMMKNTFLLDRFENSASIRKLPPVEFKLPRHKPIPKPKPETRWEKYAKEKGIKTRKRERMIWDERTQSWAPRFGYKRANDDQNDWLVELKESEDGEMDKFKERRDAKKLRVLKNRKKYLRNQLEASDKQDAVHAVENLDLKGARAGASKRGKEKLASRLKTAQVSTASLGRFDPVLENEPKRNLTNTRKRKFLPTQSTKDVERDKKIVNKLLGKHLGRLAPERTIDVNGPTKKKKKRK